MNETVSIRSLIVLTYLGLALACHQDPPPSKTAGGSAPIFRYIDLSPYGTIRLAEEFPTASPLGIEIRPGVFRLDRKDGRPIQLGDTRAILVALTPARQVCAFHFLYLAPSAFPSGVAEYESSLGAGKHEAIDSAGKVVETVTWQDAATRFQLRRTVVMTDTAVTSVLADLSHPSRPCAQ